jgi:hypothetical protein
MRQAEFAQHVGPENVCSSIAEALDRSKALLPAIRADAVPIAALES